jgi:hypothetical protein
MFRKPINPIRRLRGLVGGLITLVVGLGLLFQGWQWRTSIQNLVAAMVPAEGQVVDLVPRVHQGDTLFYPIVGNYLP